ncbi:UbiX family flavin prenyltransferase [Alphaproteobacteria bacterium]|jgi:4-hydroxy-3-polyprenylbenzoate decarboxylase|nr:UbiX family flavin prenyltransferase [Alphaproteobacteria bacterium]MDC1171548.1 UbiX family flavin prenyltransferase [Alphaproteobacteria bacterium]|tara:strand:- start:34 stop:633 length:600 start_codon:yes stop_codon:yes gene_type:complete
MINKDKNRLIIGISGASGIIYGIRLLELLRTIPDELRPETHLIISKSGEVTLAYETKLKVATVHKLADVIHANKDIGASLASGSFKTMGMIIAPCSVKTLAEIATGVTDTLISRAADVILKERRRLVCMVRETPLHAGHLKNMLSLTEMGAIIAPPVPAFYARPQSLDDMINHTIGRVLDLFEIETNFVVRWKDGKLKS